MVAMVFFNAVECCHLVNENEASFRWLWDSVPPILVYLYLFSFHHENLILLVMYTRVSKTMVSSHKTGYQIAYLRNWSPCFIFATAPCCIKCISYFCSISRQTTSVHYIGGRSKANMSWIFLEISPGISWKFAWLNLSTPCIQACISSFLCILINQSIK